jgi:hypothetical protein
MVLEDWVMDFSFYGMSIEFDWEVFFLIELDPMCPMFVGIVDV